jgi:hypothetical protein
VNKNQTKPLAFRSFNRKDYWGTHVLENMHANRWCAKVFKKNTEDILITLKGTDNLLEFHAAVWALIKVSSWFDRVFELKEHYNVAIKKIELVLASENKYFDDIDDNKSFVSNVEEQLRHLRILKKESQNEYA